jgi:hypothetical protein
MLIGLIHEHQDRRGCDPGRLAWPGRHCSPRRRDGRHGPAKPCSDLLQGRKLVRLAAITGATRTYIVARLVVLARTTIPITGYGHGGSVPSDQQQPSPSPAMIRLLSYQNRSHRRQALRSSRLIAPEAGTNPRPSGNHSAHGHDRLKHAVARPTHLQGLYDRAAAVVVRR